VIEWLRPQWLLALPVALALGWAWWRARAGAGPWRHVVDPALLEALAGSAPASSARLALALAAAALALAVVALAGPSWRMQPSPVHRDTSARVVVLDVSPSMNAVDVAPSRLARAREAVADLLRDAAGAQLGLVVFGADAFSVAPLSADPATLVHLLAGVSTGVLPRQGSRPDLGLNLARAMLVQAGAEGGEVILVGDSAGDARTREAARALAAEGFTVSVLALGTPQGGPVRDAGGSFARTESGEVRVARPEFEALERVARAGGGGFRLLSAAGATPRFSRGAPAWGAARSAPAGSAQVPSDDGAWLALLVLPFAALLFRRGWLAGLAAVALGSTLPPPAHADDWPGLWQRAEQQAAQAFERKHAGDAARVLEKLGPHSPWRAPLLYRAGRHAEAAALYAEQDTAHAHYNRGNALALAGELEAALEAYAAALERSPSLRDARHNHALVREALAKQRAQPAGGGTSKASPGKAAGSPAPGRQARARRDDAAWDEPDVDGATRSRRPAQRAAPPPGASPEEAELRRLEDLLERIPDDAGALLAARFAHQLSLRGAPHADTGAPW
jgi:Ca-activated chloride channel family protein